jgi:hypothetical protein
MALVVEKLEHNLSVSSKRVGISWKSPRTLGGIQPDRWVNLGGCRAKRQAQTDERIAKSTDGLIEGWHQPKSSDSRVGGTTGQNFHYLFKNTKTQSELNRPLNPTKTQAPSQHHDKQTAGAQKAVIKRLPS